MGCVDIILAQLLGHRAAEHFHRHGRPGNGNGQGRKHQVPDTSPGIGFQSDKIPGHKETEQDAKYIAHKDAQEEGRDTHEELIQDGNGAVQKPITHAARQDSQGYGQQHREHKGQGGQQGRNRQLLSDHVCHRHLIAVAGAHVSGQEAGQPTPIAQENRTIQTQLGTQLPDCFRGCFCAQHLGGGIARNDLKCKEGENRNHEQSNNEST